MSRSLKNSNLFRISTQWIDVVVLIALAVIATWASLYFELHLFATAFLFFGVPALYLGVQCRHKKQWKRILVMTFLFGTVGGALINHIAVVSGAWALSATEKLFFHYHIWGMFSIDDGVIWMTILALLVTLFYERFLDEGGKDKLPNRVWYAFVPMIIAVGVIAIGYTIDPQFWNLPFAYSIMAVCTLIPLVIIIVLKPRLILKFLKAALYFVPLFFLYEFVGLSLEQWFFPGQYVGMVHIGNMTLPMEEFVMWILLSSTILLACYELFVDDMR